MRDHADEATTVSRDQFLVLVGFGCGARGLYEFELVFGLSSFSPFGAAFMCVCAFVLVWAGRRSLDF
jgi:hypothetical protein